MKNYKIPKKAIIENYRIVDIQFSDGRTHPKVILTVRNLINDRYYEISEIIFIKTKANIPIKATAGLWLNLTKDGKISPTSTLKKLLDYLKIDKLDDLKNKKIFINKHFSKYWFVDCTIDKEV